MPAEIIPTSPSPRFPGRLVDSGTGPALVSKHSAPNISCLCEATSDGLTIEAATRLSSVTSNAMSPRLNNYIRTHRRRHAITLDELALLIGHKRGGPIGCVERDVRKPSLSMQIALAYIFSIPPEELFPTLHNEIRFGVLKRAEALYQALQGQPGKVARTKLDFLESIIRPDDPHDL